jgi:aldehyde dehydrogenase (NAD+)
MILAEMIDEIKLPKGVFNLVNGDGAVTGNAFNKSPRCKYDFIYRIN